MTFTYRWSSQWIVAIWALAALSGCSGEDFAEPPLGSTGQEIVDGTTAPPGAWPTAVPVLYGLAPNFPWWCGGTLISPHWVLTAAHCVMDDSPPGAWAVAIGTNGDINAGTQFISALDIYMHPDFVYPDPARSYAALNDIALIRLWSDAPGPYSRLISPARLGELVPHVTSATTVGWGDTEFAGESSELLQEGTDEFEGTGDTCVAGTILEPGELVANELCIGDGRPAFCNGDSGGPAFVKRDNEWFVLGVVNWGACQNVPAHPDVYASVAHHFDWLRSIATDLPAQSYLSAAQMAAIIL